MKILIVDDDADMLLLTSMALEKVGGHEVIAARLGIEALERAKQDRPDAILMDFMMEDLDGPALLERLRAEQEMSRIPVIFLTAKADPATIEQLLALGAKGVIGKPFDPMKLSGEVNRILGS